MNETHQRIKELTKAAIAIHTKERGLEVRSLEIIHELHRLKAPVVMNIPVRDFPKLLGLSPQTFWKRSQVARTMFRFPKIRKMLKDGQTTVTNVALASPKITEANKDKILKLLPLPKRHLQFELSRIDLAGNKVDAPETVELTITVSKAQWEKMQRAKEVLSSRGHNPDMNQVLTQAIDDLLRKRDPMEKAKRSKKRASLSRPPSPAKAQDRMGKRSGRPAIPAAVKHQVYLRDKGQCTHVYPNGERCPERSMLELDHIKPWCRSRSHSPANLHLTCRYHNQHYAREILGEAFMKRKGQSRPAHPTPNGYLGS